MRIVLALAFTIMTYSNDLETYICSGEGETYNCELVKDSPPIKDEESYDLTYIYDSPKESPPEW